MDLLRRRRGAASEQEEEASKNEAKIITDEGTDVKNKEEGSSDEQWQKVETPKEKEGEGKNDVAHDATAKPEDDHPFLQNRRHKKKYSKFIMFGTTIYWKMILLCVMVALPTAYGFCLPLLKEKVLGYGFLGCMYTVIWLYFSFMFLFHFVMTSFTNPGRAQEIETQESYKVESDNENLDMIYTPRWCTSCQCWKPPRTHHCGICDRCTLRMDHHCPFMGNCIGLYNLGHFLSMYVFILVGGTLGLIPIVFALLPSVLPFVIQLYHAAWTYEWYHVISPAHLTWFMWKEIIFGAITEVLCSHGIQLGLLAVGMVLSLLVVLALGGSYIPLIYTNSTVIENQLKNKSEYVQIFHDVVVSVGSVFYMHNWRSNLKEVFGEKVWKRCLPLPLNLPLEVGTLPKASKIASEALLMRVEEVKKDGCKHVVKSMEDLGLVTTKQAAIPADAIKQNLGPDTQEEGEKKAS